MYPIKPIQYHTNEYVEPLVELLAEANTRLALDVLWYTMPNTSPGYVRVMNLRSQFVEAEQRKLDGLGGFKKEMRRVTVAVKDVLDELLMEYPYVIPLRRDPADVGFSGGYELSTYYDDDKSSDYELAESDYRERPSNGAGLGMVLGVLLVGIVVFFLLQSFGSTPAEKSSKMVSGVPRIGWVLLLKDGDDCEQLKKSYYYVFDHHKGVEVVKTVRGGCSLLIRFPDKASAVARMKESTTLGPKFPGLRVIEL